MENLTPEPEICLICREEDYLTNLLNYHFDPLSRIHHLVHVECADAVRDGNCPLCRESEFSIIKRSGIEVDKNELQKYYDHLLSLLQKFNESSDHIIHVIEAMNDYGFEIKNLSTDFVKKFKYKLLEISCEKGNISLLKLLIESNVGNGFVLRKSVEKGDFEMIKYLIENGANIHAGNDWALRYSAYEGHLNIVKCLVEHGADIHAENDEALRASARNGNLDMVQYLRSSKEDNLDIIKYLVEHGAVIHASNALLNSENRGQLLVAKYLMDLRYKNNSD